jgi:hypothetical protein
MRDATDKTVALEAELADVEAQLRLAEQDGAELAALAEQTIAELRSEIATLKKRGMQGAGPLCRPCHRKREIIAVLFGAIFLAIWFRINPPSQAEGSLTCLGIYLAFVPLFCVCVYWWQALFVRKYAWRSWKDNDIYREIMSWLEA